MIFTPERHINGAGLVLAILKGRAPMTPGEILKVAQDRGAYQNFSARDGAREVTKLLKKLKGQCLARVVETTEDGANLWAAIGDEMSEVMPEAQPQAVETPKTEETEAETPEETPEPVTDETKRDLMFALAKNPIIDVSIAEVLEAIGKDYKKRIDERATA